MNYSGKATEVNKSLGALSYACSEKVGSSQGDSTYIFRSYQKSSTIRDHTLHIDKSGIFYKAKPTSGDQYSLSDVAWVSTYQKQG